MAYESTRQIGNTYVCGSPFNIWDLGKRKHSVSHFFGKRIVFGLSLYTWRSWWHVQCDCCQHPVH